MVPKEQSLCGLSSQEVKHRMEQGKNNCEVKSATKSVGDIIRSNVFTYFNLVFAVLAILLVLVGAYKDLFFLVVILANTGIGIFQEWHSKRILDRLMKEEEIQYVVVRDGQEKEVLSNQLVEDDIVKLSAGCMVPADSVVIEGSAMVNEALLTGEADEIAKEKEDELLSGSFLISGSIYACLKKVGKESYLNRLKIEATTTKKGEQSEMIRSLNYLIIVMGILMLPFGITLFVQSFVINKGTLYDSVTQMVAALIGMIPEGLYLLTSVTMALAVARLGKHQVLVHDMKCIETLARVDVLCVDKTGTITQEGMEVFDILCYDNGQASFSSVLRCEEPENEPEKESEKAPEKTAKEKNTNESENSLELLCALVQAQENDNETIKALKKQLKPKTKEKPEEVIHFSSKRKYSGMVLKDKTYLLGAPERLMNETVPIVTEQVKKAVEEGYRVLVFGEQEKKGGFQTLALILLSNPIRSGAEEIFAYFQDNGVEIKVLSGDHPLTVSAVAKKAGIANADNYIDAYTLTDKREYAKAIEECFVFGRVSPAQKEELVRTMQDKGKTVAMLGDGVNDVLALKGADCSIAMANGSEAASNVAQLVLMDSDFTHMPKIVMEGRRVVNNIEKSASLFIVKNIFSILLSLFAVLVVMDYPLLPSQITLVSLFTIGIPSFVLSLESNKEKIKGHFLRNIFCRSLPASFTDFLLISGYVLFGTCFGLEAKEISTVCSILLSVVGFHYLFSICRPFNRLRLILFTGLLTGFFFCVLFLGGLFSFRSIQSLSAQSLFAMGLFILLSEPIFRYWNLGMKKFFSYIGNVYNKKIEKT